MADKERSVCLRCGDALWRTAGQPWESYRGGTRCPPGQDPHIPRSDPK